MIDAFAYLPNEIINDVVIIAGERKELYFQDCVYYRSLIKLKGPWGDASRDATPIMFMTNKLVKRLSITQIFKDQMVTFEKVGMRPITHCWIDRFVDYDLFARVAPNLCESIEFYFPRDIPDDVFDMLGDRFSRIVWYCSQNLMRYRELELFRRFLCFNSLRQLELFTPSMQNGELDDILVAFVKKTTFERLSISDRSYLSPQVFLEADRVWRARSSFEVGYQKIRGLVSSASFNEIEERLQITSERRNLHPKVPIARRVVTSVERKNGDALVTMQFFNWFETEDKEEHDFKVNIKWQIWHRLLIAASYLIRLLKFIYIRFSRLEW